MEIERYDDERDFEPGGIYYDGPYYTPEDDDEDYEDEDRDTYEAEHDYGDDEDADAYEAPAPRRQTYQAPARQKLTTLKMPRLTLFRRALDDEF